MKDSLEIQDSFDLGSPQFGVRQLRADLQRETMLSLAKKHSAHADYLRARADFEEALARQTEFDAQFADVLDDDEEE
jgi:hypothetical protein